MDSFLSPIRPHPREQFADAMVHIVGVALVLLAVPVLVTLAAVWREEGAIIAAMSVYGVSLTAMILFSASYNLTAIRFPGGRIARILRRLDHGAIYLKIAGTFTGFAMLAGQGFLIVGALWAAAVAGISLKMICPFRFRRTSLLLYLGMGWAGGLVAFGIFAVLPPVTGALIAGGGLLYTIGVGFYLWQGLPYHLTIWHAFVLIASLMLYAGAVVAVLG